MIKINTGIIEIPIERDGENVGSIRFNPSDVGFADRFYRIIADFEQKEKEYRLKADNIDANKETDSYGIPKSAGEGLALLKEFCDYMKTQIDYVFGEGTSQIVFGDAMVITMFEDFINGVIPFIQNARTDKIEKYTKTRKQSSKKVMK